MKRLFVFFVSFAMAVILTGAAFFLPVNADEALLADSPSSQSGCVFLEIEGKYITQIQEALDLINQIRLEACMEGVQNPSTGAPLTEDDYVPIEWSADLEYIARLRAAESSLTMNHARTNGESIWFSGPNGVSSRAEVIAWNWGETMIGGIYQWYAEKSDWVDKTGGVTGHYTSMINPDNRYVGLGTFCSNITRFYNTTVGEFCGDLDNPDTSRGNATGSIVLTLEFKNENIISYSISGSDSLFITATVSFDDYWGNTENLILAGDSAESVQWSSSDNDIVSVSNGSLTVKSCGSAVITAKLPDGNSVTKSVLYEHSYETTTVAATCKDDGRIDKICKICGASDTQIIPKTNQHSFGKWVTTKAPTENSDGLETRTCSVCNIAETRVLRFEPQDKNTSESSSKVNDSPNDGSAASPSDSSFSGTTTTSGGDEFVTASGDDESVTTSEDGESTTASEDDASVTASDNDESTTASEDDESVTASDDNASGVTSADSASTAESNGGMTDEEHTDEYDSTDAHDTSDDDGATNRWRLIAIILGVLCAGALVLFIFFYKKRKKDDGIS